MITIDNIFDSEGVFSETKRLIMRKPMEADKSAYIGLCRDVSSSSKVYDLKEYVSYIWGNALNGTNEITIMYIDRTTDDFVGYTNLVYREDNSIEMGIDLVREYRHRGYGTEAVSEVFSVLHDRYEINELIIRIYEDNIVSKKLFSRFNLEKIATEPGNYIACLDIIRQEMGEESADELINSNPERFASESRRYINRYRLIL